MKLKSISKRVALTKLSALYFSVRRELESILEAMNLEVPRRDDKLANVLKLGGRRFTTPLHAQEKGGLR